MEKFLLLFKDKDLRNRMLFVLGILVVFRFIAHIPVPGLSAAHLRGILEKNQVLGLLNIFTGGGLTNFSIVMLGLGPYITASIIMQLLTMVIPKLEALSKEGEAGYRKINMWTRIITVPLSLLQSYGALMFLSQTVGQNLLEGMTILQKLSTILTITTGTVFLMWLGELISLKQLGNGVSLIIFSGIVSRIPLKIIQFYTDVSIDPSKIINYIVFILIAIAVVFGVVYVQEAQRNIPITFAKRVRGMRIYGGADANLPLRVNMVGMIPIIFAISVVLFPPLIGQFLLKVKLLEGVGQFLIDIFRNNIIYGFLYFILVVFFTYFYTSIIFHPEQIAENLQRQGGFIPGIRPGKETEQYLSKVTSRILLGGSLFLGLVAILPLLLQGAAGFSLVVGGASLLIVVSVAIETVRQVEAQLSMRHYERI